MLELGFGVLTVVLFFIAGGVAGTAVVVALAVREVAKRRGTSVKEVLRQMAKRQESSVNVKEVLHRAKTSIKSTASKNMLTFALHNRPEHVVLFLQMAFQQLVNR